MFKYTPSLQLAMLFLSGLFVVGGCSGSKDATAHHNASEEKLENALLWKIEGENFPSTSYVFGTIHMIDEEDFFYPNGLLSAVDAAEEIVFEIDMNMMTDMSKMMGIMDQIVMEGDTTLKMLLSEEDYALVNGFFKEKGLPLLFLEKVKPLFLSALTSFDEMPKSNSGNPLEMSGMKSYELELSNMAKDANLPISGLETMEFQMGLFDQIPYEVQAEYLVESIRMIDENQESDIFELYKSQDIDKMANSMAIDEEIEGLEEALLVKRNKNWVPLMIEKASEQPTLFAVGAGHLGGEEGVIRLLRKEGIKCSPVLGKSENK